MSRARTRPRREETRQRIYEAAAEVFVEQGVPAATVDEIVERAGFTRGAFYSSFTSKDDLAVAMLDDHLARSQAANRQLLADNPDPDSFLRALRDDLGRGDDPLHRNPLLQIELMLYVAGIPELRPRLGEHLATMRNLVGEIAAATLRSIGWEPAVQPLEMGTVLVAIEDGLRLHRLIDPDSTPPEAFIRALEVLQQVFLDRP